MRDLRYSCSFNLRKAIQRVYWERGRPNEREARNAFVEDNLRIFGAGRAGRPRSQYFDAAKVKLHQYGRLLHSVHGALLSGTLMDHRRAKP